MALKRVFCDITVYFESGEEVPDDLRDAVIRTQSRMADKMNAKGIEMFNDLTEYLDISTIDYDNEAIDAYELLANACWSSYLAQEGYPEIKVIKARFQDIPQCQCRRVMVKVAKRR